MVDLKFDKEIDALIRGKTGEAIRIADSNAGGGHLDADAFNAFTEDLLLPETKALYIKHLADCGQCRGILANLAAISPAPEESAVPAASGIVSVTIPWYQKLFAVRNLAYGMGALVLLFSGFIGYTLLDTFQAERASVSSPASMNEETLSAQNTSVAGPMEQPFDSENYAANSAANANSASASNSALSTNADRAANRSTVKRSELDVEQIFRNEPTGSGGVQAESRELEISLSATPPPPAPPPPAVSAPAPAESNEKQVAETRADMADRVGPSRSVIQSQNRSIEQPRESSRGRNVGGRAASIKRSGGKVFMLSEGVWYDEVYSGQRTINVTRSSNDYKNLDSGLRKIADDVGGTVVIVWKEKAYRIQ